jgi:peroxide stress protein YaaA
VSRHFSYSLGDERDAFIKTRRKVLGLLHGETGRLYDEDQRGGFRDLRPCNRGLFAGPDFNGSIPDREIYLPACERYCGRFFDQLTRESPNFWSEIPGYPVEISFVSGLYGLILWDEPIQDYDCHLADYTRNGKERSVQEMWRDVVTRALRDFVTEAKSSAPITVIYDLLSEEEYQNAFRWKRLESWVLKSVTESLDNRTVPTS